MLDCRSQLREASAAMWTLAWVASSSPLLANLGAMCRPLTLQYVLRMPGLLMAVSVALS